MTWWRWEEKCGGTLFGEVYWLELLLLFVVFPEFLCLEGELVVGSCFFLGDIFRMMDDDRVFLELMVLWNPMGISMGFC